MSQRKLRKAVMGMSREQEITGAGFLQHLEDIGVLRSGSPTRRVIIDAAYNSAIFVYVEELGTDRLLEMKPPDVSGMEVIVVGDESEGA